MDRHRQWAFLVTWERELSVFQPVFFNYFEDIAAAAMIQLKAQHRRGQWVLSGDLRSKRVIGVGQVRWEMWAELRIADWGFRNADCELGEGQ